MALTREELLLAKIEDIKWLVKEKEIHVNQIFPDEAWVRDDRMYGRIYKEYESLSEVLKQRDAEKVALNAEIEKQKQEVAKAKEELEKKVIKERSIIRAEQEQTAKDRFAKLLTIEKATEAQKKFANLKFKNPEKVTDLTDDGLKVLLTEILEDYTVYAQEGLLKEETIAPANKGGNPASGGTGTSADEIDYTKAVNNPLLEGEE